MRVAELVGQVPGGHLDPLQRLAPLEDELRGGETKQRRLRAPRPRARQPRAHPGHLDRAEEQALVRQA
eukprot:2520698-Pyramimonas_sp.AAC.1